MKFALITLTEEALQDIGFHNLPSDILKVRVVGRDPAHGTVLAFIESNLLPEKGFNGFMSLSITVNDSGSTVSFDSVATTPDLADNALAQIYLKLKVDAGALDELLLSS